MPAPGEPLWLPEDRAWALALAQVEADACPECGEAWSETTDAANEYAYRADLVKCHACATGARAVRNHQDGHGTTDGLHVHIEKRR